jgi:hypothetical protein
MLLAGLALYAGPTAPGSSDIAYADGGDCEDSDTGSINSTNDNLASFSAPTGEVVTAVCIKAGNDHSGDLTQNGNYSTTFAFLGAGTATCYFTVSGVGTNDVTVTRNGTCSGLGNGISHIDAYHSEPEEGSGTIIIIKDTVPNADVNFSFTDNIPDCTVGPLNDDGSGTENMVTCSEVPVAVYQVIENDPSPAYNLSALACVSEGGTDDEDENLTTRTATITLQDGETVTCTFTNTPPDPQGEGATLTIRKLCVPDDDPGVFDILVDDEIFGDGNDIECGEGTGTHDIEPGEYTVSEEGANGTEIGDYTVTFSEDCDENGNITIEEGDSAVCVITNTRVETPETTLTIRKLCEPSDDPGVFDILVDDEIFGDGNNIECGEGTGTHAIEPGEYTVSEEGANGTDINDYTVTFSEDCDENGNITIEEGDNAVCVITNTRVSEDDPATIRIIKDTNPETSGIEFDFDSALLGDFDLEDDESVLFQVGPGGVFVVTENLFGDWDLVAINCSGAGVVFNVNLAAETVTITIEDGEDAVCTFVNELEEDEEVETPTPTNTPTTTTTTQTFVPTPTPTPTLVQQQLGVQVTPTAPVRALPSTGNGGYVDEGDNRYLWLAFAGFLGLGLTGLVRLSALRREDEL